MSTKIHVIIPVKSNEDLEYLQSTLAEIMYTLSQLEDPCAHMESIYWLSKILVLSYCKE